MVLVCGSESKGTLRVKKVLTRAHPPSPTKGEGSLSYIPVYHPSPSPC